MEIFGRYLFSLGSQYKDFSIARAIMMKGIAKPTEKTISKNTPDQRVVAEAAKNKIVAKIGPMQGVQPKAKVAHRIKELNALPGFK